MCVLTKTKNSGQKKKQQLKMSMICMLISPHTYYDYQSENWELRIGIVQWCLQYRFSLQQTCTFCISACVPRNRGSIAAIPVHTQYPRTFGRQYYSSLIVYAQLEASRVYIENLCTSHSVMDFAGVYRYIVHFIQAKCFLLCGRTAHVLHFRFLHVNLVGLC